MTDAEGTEVGRLAAVMRYPVKSTAGESLTTAEVTGRGIVGDVHLEIRPEEDVPHHDEVPIHIVTTAGIRRLERLLGETIEAVRFRPNLVVDVPGDDLVDGAWRGRDLAVGDDVVLRVGDTMPRCRMVGLAQRGLPERQGLLARMAAVHGPGFGLKATVVHRGQVHAGDRVVLA